MSVSAINDLHHEWCLKIVPKLHEPLGEYNFQTSRVIYHINII